MTTDKLAPNGMSKIDVHLIGTDGNAFAMIGRCQKVMRSAKWDDALIKDFGEKCMESASYDALLRFIASYCDIH